jgi:hypothetical protein
MTSRYTHLHRRLIIPFVRALAGIPSSLTHDGALLLQGAIPSPRAIGVENIPVDTSFVLTLNHFDRPGLGTWWTGVLVLITVAAHRTREPRDVHFMMAREWWYPDKLGRTIKQPITRWAFGQISKTYGLITLPPLVDEYRGQAAIAIRHALALTRGESPQLVALAPEGHTGENGALCKPPFGSGLFMLMLTHDTLPILPVGIYEDDVLIANFGKPFDLCVPRHIARAERDALAAQRVMVEIGKLLPERMWGVYREEIESEVLK